jgi:3-ketosteroid 9alpha-monooxygenase subunit B
MCPIRAGKAAVVRAWPPVVEGEVDMASCDILEPEDLQDGLILACQARPVSADVHIEF